MSLHKVSCVSLGASSKRLVFVLVNQIFVLILAGVLFQPMSTHCCDLKISVPQHIFNRIKTQPDMKRNQTNTETGAFNCYTAIKGFTDSTSLHISDFTLSLLTSHAFRRHWLSNSCLVNQCSSTALCVTDGIFENKKKVHTLKQSKQINLSGNIDFRFIM